MCFIYTGLGSLLLKNLRFRDLLRRDSMGAPPASLDNDLWRPLPGSADMQREPISGKLISRQRTMIYYYNCIDMLNLFARELEKSGYLILFYSDEYVLIIITHF